MKSKKKGLNERIVVAVLYEIVGRRGLRQAWDDIDEDIQLEIAEECEKLVLDLLEQ